MGYDRDESYPLEFEPNGIQFGSKSKGNCHHDHIPFNEKGIGNIVFSVQCDLFTRRKFIRDLNFGKFIRDFASLEIKTEAYWRKIDFWFLTK